MSPTSRDPVEPQPGMRRDLRRAREGTFATAVELREFVQNLKGKSPQEVLGAVANSGLAQGVVLSSLITLIVMAVFTIGPYFWYEKPKPVQKEPVAAAQPVAAVAPVATAASPADKSQATAKSAAANAQQTLEKLGETETKTADPKVNPLDNLDDLLDTKK